MSSKRAAQALQASWHRGQGLKAAVNDVLFVGDRQMQRLFKARLGLTPKAYFKGMRFRASNGR